MFWTINKHGWRTGGACSTLHHGRRLDSFLRRNRKESSYSQRWLGACEKFNIDFFITADGDDLFCEPTLIDLALNQYITSKPDFIQTNEVVCGAFTFGIKYSALKKVRSILKFINCFI